MPAPAASRKLKKGDHVFLIDGSSFIFRAYFAMFKAAQSRGRSFTRSDGLPNGAVLTFCNMLWKLLREGLNDVMPTHVAVVFDYSGQTFRNEIYADYKGHRPDPPDELIPQFPLMRDAVRAFGLIPIEQEGFEADDLIATYARVTLESGADVSIVAGDKDLMQLVRPGVTMLDPMPGNERRIGPEEVVERFGVPPEKVPDVQALMGDKTDNVPGVPGIGVKTAAELINQFGDLETLLARTSEIKQEKRRQLLTEFAEQARMSRRLVLLDDRVPLQYPPEDLPLGARDPRMLIAFLKAMEFSALTKRVGEATATDPNTVEADPDLRAEHAGSGVPAAPPLEAAFPPEPTARESGARDGDAARRNGAPGAAAVAATTEARQLSLGLPAAAPDRRRTPAASTEVRTPADLVRERQAALTGLGFETAGYEIIADADALGRWIAHATDQGFVAIDLAITSPDPMIAALTGIALALAPNRAAYVPLGHRPGDDLLSGTGLVSGQIAEHEALALLKPMLESAGVLKIGHDLKPDVLVLERHGISLKSFDDVMLMSYVLDAGRNAHDLASLAHRHLGHAIADVADVTGKGRTQVPFATIETARACAFCGEGPDASLRVWRLLKARLVAEHMSTVYHTLERPLVPVLARMERRGISIDTQVLSRLSGEFSQKSARLEAEIQELAGEPLNPGSPKQIGDILFGKMKLEGGRKTKTGAWSTSASILDDLAEQGHVLPTRILEWRQITKLQSTYTDLLPSFVNPDTQRVHTSYALAATTTGRLSSSEPNLQNIPIRTEEGRKIRRAFIAAPGTKLVSADYSQIELRLLAEIADIAALKHAFRDGVDIHALTGQGHAGRSAPARQGDQLRHHLRHLGLWPRQPARHIARRGGRPHPEVFRAFSRHPRLHGPDQGGMPPRRLRHDAVRPQVPLPGHHGVQSVDPLVQRTRRHQCAFAGHGGRHHPPRHDPHGGGARQTAAQRPHAAASSRRTGVRGA
jgi:DNA polymerase-1